MAKKLSNLRLVSDQTVADSFNISASLSSDQLTITIDTPIVSFDFFKGGSLANSGLGSSDFYYLTLDDTVSDPKFLLTDPSLGTISFSLRNINDDQNSDNIQWEVDVIDESATPTDKSLSNLTLISDQSTADAYGLSANLSSDQKTVTFNNTPQESFDFYKDGSLVETVTGANSYYFTFDSTIPDPKTLLSDPATGTVSLSIENINDDGTSTPVEWEVDIVGGSVPSNTSDGQSNELASEANEIASEANEILSGLATTLGGVKDALENLAASVQTLSDRGSNVEEGIVITPANSDDWALQRAATVSALREAFQLDNVFDEMQNPTDLPVQARSEDELADVQKRSDAIEPQGNNSDDYPNINGGGNAGTPVDLSEFETPTDTQLNNDNGDEEGTHPCHPL